jgi:hypothetical protein
MHKKIRADAQQKGAISTILKYVVIFWRHQKERHIFRLNAKRMPREIINESQLLERIPGLTSRQLRELRLRRKIPYFAPSYRLRLYDPEAVLKALSRFETIEVGARR